MGLVGKLLYLADNFANACDTPDEAIIETLRKAAGVIIAQQQRIGQYPGNQSKMWNDVMHVALAGLLARISPEDWVSPWPRSALLEAFHVADECARLRAERAEKSAAAEKPKETICPVCGNRGMIFNPMSLGPPQSLCPACFPERAEKEKSE